MVLRRIALVALLVFTLGGCASSPDTTGPMPPASDLAATSAKSLTTLRSVTFDLKTNGSAAGLNVHDASGVVTRGGGPYGWAKGEADIQERTERVQYDFLIKGDRLQLTNSDGRTFARPVSERFNPARLLSKQHGLYQLLTHAKGLQTETQEEFEGTKAYRITGELTGSALSAVLPEAAGLTENIDVKFWIGNGADRNLLRVWLQFPPRHENEGAVMLELALSDHNQADAGATS